MNDHLLLYVFCLSVSFVSLCLFPSAFVLLFSSVGCSLDLPSAFVCFPRCSAYSSHFSVDIPRCHVHTPHCPYTTQSGAKGAGCHVPVSPNLLGNFSMKPLLLRVRISLPFNIASYNVHGTACTEQEKVK